MTLNEIMNMYQVDEAIAVAQAMPMTPPKAYKTRAARLADLYEIRARLYAEAGASKQRLASIYRAACEDAATYSRNQVKFWRGQA